jgi:hypothetical protein
MITAVPGSLAKNSGNIKEAANKYPFICKNTNSEVFWEITGNFNGETIRETNGPEQGSHWQKGKNYVNPICKRAG